MDNPVLKFSGKQKLSKAEKKRRITFCVEMIEKGYNDAKIKDAFIIEFSRSERTAQEYLKLAYDEISKIFTHEKTEHFNKVLSILHQLYLDASKRGHTKVCVSIIQEMNKMLGNYEAQKLSVKIDEWECTFGGENENKDA